MKPEALDAFATQSIRPGALEAAAADQGDTSKSGVQNMEEKKNDVSLNTALEVNSGFNNRSLYRREPNWSGQP